MVWFVAPWQVEDSKGKTRVVDADVIRKRFGLFDKISHQPAKLGARCVGIRWSLSLQLLILMSSQVQPRLYVVACNSGALLFPLATQLVYSSLSKSQVLHYHQIGAIPDIVEKDEKGAETTNHTDGAGTMSLECVRLCSVGRACSDQRATQQASRPGVAGPAGERLPTRFGRRSADGRPVSPRRIE